MILHRHQDLERATPTPGLFRIIAMGAITQGMVTVDRAGRAGLTPIESRRR